MVRSGWAGALTISNQLGLEATAGPATTGPAAADRAATRTGIKPRNANVVNNVQGTSHFLKYGGGQARAFSVRLRLVGRK